jgi:3-hydroxyacyl-CoA dehydrogenase
MLNIRTVAVIGSGTMGAGIAEVAASHGHQVLIYDISADAISRAIDGIRQRLASRVTRGSSAEQRTDPRPTGSGDGYRCAGRGRFGD